MKVYSTCVHRRWEQIQNYKDFDLEVKHIIIGVGGAVIPQV